MTQHNVEGSSNRSPPSSAVGVISGKKKGKNVQIGDNPEDQSHTQDRSLTAPQPPEIPIPHTPTKRFPMGPVTNQLHYIRHNIIKSLMRHKSSAPFMQAVDPVKLKIPYYHLFIRNPMDLSTIRARLTNRYYQSAEECLKDFQLLFSNCYIYNNAETIIVKQARELESLLVRKVSEMPPVEEEQAVESHPRRSSTGSARTDDGEDFDAPLTPDMASTESSPSSGRPSLRLRQVMTKQPVTMVVGNKQTVNNILSSSEDDSDKEEESCDQDEETSGNEAEPKEQRPVKKTTTILQTLSGLELVLQQRRKKQMTLIQQQMNNLQKQMKALQEEEREFSRLFKNFNQPSTSKGFLSAAAGKKSKSSLSAPKKDRRPTAIRSSIAKNSHPPVTQPQSSQPKRKTSSGSVTSNVSPGSTFGSREAKQRKLDTSTNEDAGSSPPPASSSMLHTSSATPPASSSMLHASSATPPASSSMLHASSATPAAISSVANQSWCPLFSSPDKSKSLDNEQLAKLTAAINKLQSDDFDKIVEIATYYCAIADEDDGDGMVNFALLPTAIQWEVVEIVENAIIPKGVSPERNAPGKNTPVFMDMVPVAEEPAYDVGCQSITFHADSSDFHVHPVSPTPIMPRTNSSSDENEADCGHPGSLSPSATTTNDVFLAVPQAGKAQSSSVVHTLSNDNTDELNIYCSDSDRDENNEEEERDDPTLDMY